MRVKFTLRKASTPGGSKNRLEGSEAVHVMAGRSTVGRGGKY